MLQHVGEQCKHLIESAADRRARAGQRCLYEVVQLVAALQNSAVWQDHPELSTRCNAAAQVLLLHLIKVCYSQTSAATLRASV